MKKVIFMTLLSLALLPACCWRKKTEQKCVQPETCQEESVTVTKQTRVSGPVTKEVRWQKTDLQ
ncbi:MAG: hypothetical protein WCE21_05530 [Candidatus Babeliales bacterium]